MATSKDPANPSQPNQNHTKSDGTKPNTAISAILDPEFIPTLDDTPTTQHVKSHFLLLSMIIGGVLAAWFMGLELFQGPENQSWGQWALGLGSVVAAGVALLYVVGGHYIDWWELVAGYWWLSLPVGGAAALLFVMAEEKSRGLPEVD